MTIMIPAGTHEYYTKHDQHFCPKSETFTGADSLITAQRNGWQMVGLAYREDVLLSGGRHTTVYHFELHKHGETIVMPVVSNPFVVRILRSRQIDILPARQMPENTVQSLLTTA